MKLLLITPLQLTENDTLQMIDGFNTQYPVGTLFNVISDNDHANKEWGPIISTPNWAEQSQFRLYTQELHHFKEVY